MTNLESLLTLPALAARYITEHGWTQGIEQNDNGEVCLTGALRLCAPVPGDGAIARAVFRSRWRAEDWNDTEGRTQDEVVGYLANTEITDADLEDTFGPQWREVVGMVRQAASATDEQIDALATRVVGQTTARSAAMVAALNASRKAVWNAAWEAAWTTAAWQDWEALWDVTRNAVLATVTRDLIGTKDYTQEDHDLLMTQWRAVFK